MKRKKRVDTRPLDQRVKKIPYVYDQDGKKHNLTQKIKIPKKVRFSKVEDENENKSEK